MNSLFEQLLNLPRLSKHILICAVDWLLLSIAIWGAYSLRLGYLYVPPNAASVLVLFVTVSATIVTFIRIGLYRAVIRYINGKVIIAAILGATISAVVFATASFLLHVFTPRSVPIIYWTLALIFTAGTRLFMRFLFQVGAVKGRKPVLIYGAGLAGRELATALLGGNKYLPVAFLDDDERNQKSVVHGLRVHAPSALSTLLQRYEAEVVLLALDDNARRHKSKVLKYLEPFSVRILTVPSMSDVVAGKATISDLKDVDIEDLLGREPVDPIPELLAGSIRGRSVLVTGAGGSIGSELCRQIVKLEPARLTMLDISEFGLYRVEQELRDILAAERLDVEVNAVLGSVQKEHRMEVILSAFEIETVYHAAAYKHVPIVEQNVVEGVRNNVFGTWYAAEAAIRAKVKTFVLVSSDKAVRPTNVMGASKRLAELVLQGLAERQTQTQFCMVRFGNVLGSSGSVVPLFRQQILKGGPVTVTHPDIFRFFMTIPEAAQLVLQAGSMAHGGEVYVLNMGEPVRILELARKMIHLMGCEVRDEAHPNGDIEIHFSGLRAGEKLFEELLIDGNAEGTPHPSIMKASEERLSWPELTQLLDRLDSACHEFDCRLVISLLQQAATQFTPMESAGDLVTTQARSVLKRLASVHSIQPSIR